MYQGERVVPCAWYMYAGTISSCTTVLTGKGKGYINYLWAYWPPLTPPIVTVQALPSSYRGFQVASQNEKCQVQSPLTLTSATEVFRLLNQDPFKILTHVYWWESVQYVPSPFTCRRPARKYARHQSNDEHTVLWLGLQVQSLFQ